ncbi:MAG: glutamate--tRNA ligase [Flavobacteriales bacterium]|nr:glutamate--tRNA ligase [Flavobacteriales bacterium]
MSDKKVRVRFAPSPTGPLHLGGVRTALYNYLFARKHGGDFLLRIEDTDQTRYVPGAEEYIIESLKWLGIMYDEGPGKEGEFAPYRQSERKPMYRQYAEQLIESGHAYYAFDTTEELETMRVNLQKAGSSSPSYNFISRNSMKNSLTLPADEVQRRIDNGDPYVIRIKIPRNEEVHLEDLVRGVVVVNTNTLDDKVLFKSDGMPTYHLANIVDDYLMKITHVIRGEEWLPSAPTHVLLYRFLGWEADMPSFAHLPLILKPDGNGKLSKRDGDRLGFPVFPLQWTDPNSGEVSSGYRESGYFKEAVINILALLGWHPTDNQELFSLDELVEAFSLEKVSKAGAKFDFEKAKWFNREYLKSTPDKELAEAVKPYAIAGGADVSDEYLQGACRLMKERATFIKDVFEKGRYLFFAPSAYDENTLAKKWKPGTADFISQLLADLSTDEAFTGASLESRGKAWLEANKLGFGAIMPVFRVLLTGEGEGPAIFEICALLGKEEMKSRIESGLSVCKSKYE